MELKERLLKNRSISLRGCWEWIAYRSNEGYGRICINGKVKRTHRIAWEFFMGPIPIGLFVCHRCDNPPCFNPRHLYLATNSQNMKDAFKNGLTSHLGELNPRAKITRVKANKIRLLVAAGKPQNQVARKFGLAPTTINSIIKGIIWK